VLLRPARPRLLPRLIPLRLVPRLARLPWLFPRLPLRLEPRLAPVLRVRLARPAGVRLVVTSSRMVSASGSLSMSGMFGIVNLPGVIAASGVPRRNVRGRFRRAKPSHERDASWH